MNTILGIISGLFQQSVITGFNLHFAHINLIMINKIALFNGQFLFVLKFFGELALVFILGGLIGKLLHLDKVGTENKPDTRSHS